ncbi:uncharacterized protein [Diabrotica undecimpunctata]|uniref:uncharacterized protein n=1 Tax=Diabrotica undecimpunctata TaxID=50387 RepID=UPI003B639E0B
MDLLKRERGTCKSTITRILNWINNSLDIQTNTFELDHRKAHLVNTFNNYNDICNKIESIDAVDLHTENREEIEDKYFSAMSRIDGKLSQLTLSNSSSSPSHSQSQEPASNSNVRLPPISVPNFNGEYSKWLSFYQLFSSLVKDNNSITKAQKLIYLKSSLKGEPLTLIDSLEVTHENFDLAITILEKKYDNNLAIINSHINAIIDFPTLSKSNYHSLNEFVNDLKRHIDSLKILHVPIESWDYLLINIIIRKLDFATKRYYGERRDRDNTPSIVELFEILNERCNILADLTYTSDSKREKSHGKYNATSLHLNASATLPSRVYSKCNYCNDSAHKIYKCRKFSSLPHSEKYNFLKANHMCSNCLGTKHTHADCPSRTCSICSKKHHTLLHQNSYAQNTNYSGSSHSPHSENYRSNINGNHSRFNHSTQNPSYDNRTKHNSFRQPNDASPTTSQNTNSPSLSYQHKNTTHSTEPLRTNNVQPSTSNNFPDNGNDSSVALSATNKSFTYSSVLLSTVQVNLIDKSGMPLLIKAVLDSGSQKTFCSQELLSKINCKIYHRELQISGISQGSFTSNLMANINVHSPNLKSQHLNLNCAVIPKITCQLPQFHIQPNKLNIPKGFTLADKHFYQKSNIDLLIGADYYYDILQPGLVKLGHNLPTLFNTIFGWVIAGNVPNYAQSKNDVSLFVQTQNTHSSDSNLEALVSKFWETEDCPGEKILSPDDQLAESNFINHLKILENGRLQVNLPQKSPSEHLKLGESFQITKKRFESLEKRFKNDSNLYNAYKLFIDQYISLNHGKYVPLTYHNSLDENKYFLPHHCVLKDSATTKLRVVFDGSAKTTSGYSLNQILLTGFQTQPDLFDILCRFRQFKFVFIADIEKMYRQINVNPNQTFLQNILWRDSPHEPLKCIELTSVTYGVTCSSFLATRCLKEIATLNTTKHPLGSDALLNQTYVDDILYGTNTLAELEAAYHELNSILNGHSITLHKWVSNSAEFSAKYIRSSQSNYEITSNNLNTNKVLGLSWHPLDDYFTISIPSPPAADNSFTKRNALSALAKIFDPIGLLGSFTVTGKVFIQKLWLNKLNWDDPLPETLAKEWKRFINDLTLLESLKVPRNLFNSRQISKIEIHGFADASSKAQAAVLYFRTIYADDTISCTLIASKSRLAPLKTVSIPRLELSAMLLLSRLTKKINSTFANRLHFSSINLWTDSQIALCWINSSASRWNTYVANRVTQIQDLTSNFSWRHVRSHENAADCLSRGLTATEFLNSRMWWKGPEFLLKTDLNLTTFNPNSTQVLLPDEKVSSLIISSKISTQDEFINNLFSRFSSYSKLLRTTAYIYRFSFNARNSSDKKLGILSPDELRSASISIFKAIQSLKFSKEILEIKTQGITSNKSLITLNPFLNADGLLCVGGRLKNANIPYEQKHPILLPSNSHIINLLLTHEHCRLGHAGPQTTLSNVRLNYWPLNGLRTLKKIVKNCHVCFRFRAKPMEQIMGNLPQVRITPSRPFQNVGCDFGGPFLIKSSKLRKAPMQKCYISIFVCLATKAVHIELVSSLSTDSFLLCLKRFIARRGLPSLIYSDNATNFAGSKNELKDLREFFKSPSFSNDMQNFAAQNFIEWKFIPPHSPHWGGIWEAAIKSAKYHIRRMIGNAYLVFEEFSTILSQIEAILNSRPICPLSNDPSDLQCLTPGHFLIGSSLTSYPEKTLLHLPINRLNFLQRCSQIQQSFWKRWSVEYLSQLHSRPKWSKVSQNIKINDLVLLRTDNCPPLKWPTARVLELFPGSDNHVRAVKIRTATGEAVRPITKLYLLPQFD